MSSTSSDYPSFPSVRDAKKQSISEKYYTLLNQYLTDYNSFMNATDDTTKTTYSAKLKTTNNQLISIVTQLNDHNKVVEKDIASNLELDKTDETLFKNKLDMDQIKNDIEKRNQNYISSRQLALQMEQLSRYQSRIYWINWILIIILTIAIGYICIQINEDNPFLEPLLSFFSMSPSKSIGGKLRKYGRGLYRN